MSRIIVIIGITGTQVITLKLSLYRFQSLNSF
jgi:hypothetical protein